MVHISLSPNLQKDDVFAALARLFAFWRWNSDKYIKKIQKEFSQYFNNKNTYLFNSGRSALYIFLRSLELKNEDEVIIQAFTCNAVANPIIWAGGKPVYADIDGTYNIDPAKLEEKITSRTKAVVIQHTFGIPAKLDEILEITGRNNILVIEDCAHALGAEYKGKKIGTFGDAAFFSFGRDKVISSVYGGALIVNNNELKSAAEEEYNKLSNPSIFWTLQQLLHPIITSIVLATYSWYGKYLLFGAQKLKLLSFAVTRGERGGEMPKYFPARLPDPLAHLALGQFKKLDKFNSHRKKLAQIYQDTLRERPEFKIVQNYDKGAIFLRYPVRHKNARGIIKKAKKQGFILGDWYREIIAPTGTDMEKINYRGGCEYAEKKAPNIINLPTNIRTTERKAERLVQFIITNA